MSVRTLIRTALCLGLITVAAPALTHANDAAGPVLAVISHPVQDYAAWRPVYENAATIRNKAGVTAAEVFHDPANPNQMVIIHRFASVAAAHAFLNDPDLDAAMKRGGVLSAPMSIIASSQAGKTSAQAGPVLAVISHPVKDYAAWHTVYESVARLRQKAGITAAEVFRDEKDANNVVIIHRFATVTAAQSFLADPELAAAMKRGGVLATPTTIIAVKN